MHNRRLQFRSATVILCLSGLLLSLTPLSADAFDVTGKVTNGTTGKGQHPITISVVNPSAGMADENTVETIDDKGNFKIEHLHDDVSVYLLRVEYKGVNYTELIQYDGRSPFVIDMEVYEPTPSFDDVQVSIPHMMLTRSGDTLSVDQFFEISNATSPPKTVYGDELFTIFLPEDKIRLNSLHAITHRIPIEVEALPTHEAGFHAVDHAIKPGETQISVSYELPYGQARYDYQEPLRYDIDELMIVTQDPTILVTSQNTPIEVIENFHGLTGYRIVNLKQSTTLALTFSGGSSVRTASTNPTVFVRPAETWSLSLVLMIVLVLMMTGLLLNVASKPPSPEADREVMLAQKEALLDQLARLDDLHKTGTVSDQIYKIKRDELMNVLAQIYYRTTIQQTLSTGEAEDQKGAARV